MDHGDANAIRAALLANVGIALAKLLGFWFTRSASMLAESIHSLADTGNQLLLFVGARGARRVADAEHPFGYGRVRYFWAFMVALVMFTLGGLFSIGEGIEKLLAPAPISSPAWALAILGVAMALEGWSLRTAVRNARTVVGEQSWWTFIHRSKSPELPVMLLEDTGALIGLCFAVAGVGLAALTGEPRWDALGSFAIGLLLVAIAGVLAVETQSLLIGEAASPARVQAIRAAIEDAADVERVVELRTSHVGPDQIVVAGRIAVPLDLSVPQLVAALGAARSRVQRAVPAARWIYLEPALETEVREGVAERDPAADAAAAQDAQDGGPPDRRPG